MATTTSIPPPHRPTGSLHSSSAFRSDTTAAEALLTESDMEALEQQLVDDQHRQHRRLRDLHEEDDEDEEVMKSLMAESSISASSGGGGGYSPPAWRRLGNGDRSSGFWRYGGDNILGDVSVGDVNRRRGSGIGQQLQQQQRGPHFQQFQQRNGGSGRPTPFNHLQFGGRQQGRQQWQQQQDFGMYDEYEENENEEDSALARAIRTRLPGSMSPEKGRSPEPEIPTSIDRAVARTREGTPLVKRERSETPMPMSPGPENYIKFAVRAEVQHRTEPIESLILFIRSRFATITSTWTSLLLTLITTLVSICLARTLLLHPVAPRPAPDLVKVAGIARSFEPLIYFSESGVTQVNELQATGVAVWDLGESVRSSNMTSAPIIVKELDELSESLKTLAVELTKFFANVDGDIDEILSVMDWARRELFTLSSTPFYMAGNGNTPSFPPPSLATTVFDNAHTLLSSIGLLENPVTGAPTKLGQLSLGLFGPSTPQRARQILTRTFHGFITVLEEAVTNELQHSLSLFALFESIDRQFLNLARSVARESSAQDNQHIDLLSSLWTRILGPRASDLHKYERNRDLLRNVREKTVRNKGVLVEHNHKLLALKANLENLRKKLVSPLVRSENSSTVGVEEQIRGLEEVGGYLEGVRKRQKGRLMEMLYGAGSGYKEMGDR